jgi:pyruvate,water dikinase
VRENLHPLQRWVFGRLLRSTVVYLGLRERVSLLLSEDAYLMRRVFQALGQGLVERGVLNEADDIFYLYLDEIDTFLSGDVPETRAEDLVARRRQEMAADAEIELPDTICGDLPPVGAELPEHSGEFLVGIGGSSGVVQGYARIIRDPLAAPDDLGPNDILIVPFTDVGWTPLFAGIGGIVAETGGQLSHTAIVAREYDLPAVVSVPGVTRKLAEFQPITVDGLAGRVYLGHVLDRKESRA